MLTAQNNEEYCIGKQRLQHIPQESVTSFLVYLAKSLGGDDTDNEIAWFQFPHKQLPDQWNVFKHSQCWLLHAHM